MEILKISSKSNPNSVAGAIAGLVKESNKAEMQAIGAGALNQAVKAVAIARGFVAPAGVDLVCIPAFAEVEVEGEDRKGMAERSYSSNLTNRKNSSVLTGCKIVIYASQRLNLK